MPESSSWDSGRRIIFGVLPMDLGSWWEISENGDRGFTQNFDARLVSIVVCPGEPVLEKLFRIRKYTLFENGYVQNYHTDHFGFRQKKAGIWKNVTKKTKMVKFPFLRLSGKWINSSGVSSQKLACVRLLPQGLLFLKNEHFRKFGTCPFWKSVHFLIFGDFFKNGSPGQTTMLTRRAAKFCVKPRSPFSEISHHDPKAIGKAPKIVPLPECQPELLGYVHFTFFHIIFILFSHFCEMCDFFMLNTGWMLRSKLRIVDEQTQTPWFIWKCRSNSSCGTKLILWETYAQQHARAN